MMQIAEIGEMLDAGDGCVRSYLQKTSPEKGHKELHL